MVDALVRFAFRSLFDVPNKCRKPCLWGGKEEETFEYLSSNYAMICPEQLDSFQRNDDALHYFLEVAISILYYNSSFLHQIVKTSKSKTTTKKYLKLPFVRDAVELCRFLDNMFNKHVIKKRLTSVDELQKILALAKKRKLIVLLCFNSVFRESRRV